MDAGDVAAVLWQQRQSYLEAIADLTDVKDAADATPATQLVADAAMLHIEADLRWLDLCESRLQELKPPIK